VSEVQKREVESAKIWLHMLLSSIAPFEDILWERGWQRIENMPNVWISPTGETSFLAEAIKSLIPKESEHNA